MPEHRVQPQDTSVRVSDYQDMDTPVFITFDVTFASSGVFNGDLFLFKAQPGPDDGQQFSPFRLDSRKFAISRKSALSAPTLELALPPGFTVLNAPKDADVKGELGRFQRAIKQEAGKMITSRNETFRADIPPARYQEAKDYYKAYIKASDESVVLKKTGD